MSNKFTKYLQGGGQNPKGNLADFQHAARLYVDDTFRLAPKTKFLYYVVFNINPDAIAKTTFQNQNRSEINYLVKSADLPKYTLNNEELNQYNRKTRSYTRITYDPVNITFHDDNADVTNTFWELYYEYYFRDGSNLSEPYTDVNPPAYQNKAFKAKNSQPFRYGLDNNVNDPFIRSIQLITLSKQKFYSYLLCNPKIISWSHDSVDQSEGNGILQNEMSIGYDAVIYSKGKVEQGNPAGFAELHYDTVPSPLTKTKGVGKNEVFGDVGGNSSKSNPLEYLDPIRNANQSYNNLGNRAPFGAGTPSFINAPQNVYYTKNSSSGLPNYNFGSANDIARATNSEINKGASGIYKGFNQKIDNPNNVIDYNYNTNSENRVIAAQNEFAGVEGNRATDAFRNTLPSANDPNLMSAFAEESNRSRSGNSAALLQDQAVTLDLSKYSLSDSKFVDTTAELIANNPGNRDIPTSPFG